MRVYGEESNALNIIRDHLDRDGTTAIHSDLRRLFSVDMDQQSIAGSSPGQSSQGLSSSAIVGLAVALVTLSVGMVGLFAVQVRRHRRGQSQSSEQDFGSESERDESISEDSLDLQVETVDFEPETALVVSGKAQRPRSVIIDPDLLSGESELL